MSYICIYLKSKGVAKIYAHSVLPISFRINRPPPAIKAQVKFKFEKGLMYIVTKKKIDTKNQWEELYIAYNNKKV